MDWMVVGINIGIKRFGKRFESKAGTWHVSVFLDICINSCVGTRLVLGSKVQIGCIHVQFNLEIARDFTCKSVIVFDRIDIRCTTPAIIYYWADSMQELLPQPQQRDLILL